MPKDKGYLCIYELVVEPSNRRRGIGTAIIRECHTIALQLGCHKICVVPRPVEAGTSEEQLNRWYTKLGFKPSDEQADLLEIVLS
ncbi:MAG: GNAT family N-acetyltransferase [Acidobacteria bacterium]|nr:GNAT family N-acetyltransferase [Acidobacteriota bacterium]